jgi:hypothetical protein
MSRNDFVPMLCFAIMRMASVPSQRYFTYSVLTRSSPVPVTSHTEGYHVPYSLYCSVMLTDILLFTLYYTWPLTKRFLHQNSLIHFLFRPSQSRDQCTVPLLISTAVTVLVGWQKV